jgi:hypothetical protein
MPYALCSLSIVIITRNTKDLLRNLLKSIAADNTLNNILKDIIVIDNYSTDGTNPMVQKEFPQVFLHRNDRNRGFAAAANMGIADSRGNYILLLNSDTLLIEGEVAAMVQFMEENPDVGICGPQLVYEDMKPQRSFAHIPSLLPEIIPRFLLELLFPARYSVKSSSAFSADPKSHQLRTKHSELRTPPQVVFDVPSLIGAAIIVRKSLLDDLGGFDERFFFFLEETDVCVRAKARGAHVVFLPHRKMVHLQGRTVRKNWVQGRIQYNISLYKFIRKHHGRLYYGVFQGVRFMKSLAVPLVLSVFFPMLLHKRTRRTFEYYVNLLLWHCRGCPEEAGLLANSRE